MQRAEVRTAGGQLLAAGIEDLAQVMDRAAQRLDPVHIGGRCVAVETQLQVQPDARHVGEPPEFVPARHDADAAADRR